MYLNAAVFGIPREYVDEHLDEILEFAELEEFADQPVKTYSSGMYLRLGFSIAMHVQPDILLLDEILAVGDESFQQKCHGRIWEFKRAGGTIVFVSHDPNAVERLCERAMLLERGHVIESGTPEDVLRTYHRQLAARPTPQVAAAPAAGTVATGPVRFLDLRAIAGDGAIRTRFLEAEPLVLETTLLAETGAEGVQFTLTFRDAAGQLIASRTNASVSLRPGIPEAVRLHVAELPFRDGIYRIDVVVLSHDSDEILVEQEKALELSSSRTSPARAGRCDWRAPGSCRSPRRRWNASQRLQPGSADGVPAARRASRTGGPARPAQPASGGWSSSSASAAWNSYGSANQSPPPERRDCPTSTSLTAFASVGRACAQASSATIERLS